MLHTYFLTGRTRINAIVLGHASKLIVAVSPKATAPLAMIFVEPKTNSFFGYWQSEGKTREAAYSHDLMLQLMTEFDADWTERGWKSHEPWRIHSRFDGRIRDLLIRRVAASLGA